jgi:hypothetical protein
MFLRDVLSMPAKKVEGKGGRVEQIANENERSVLMEMNEVKTCTFRSILEDQSGNLREAVFMVSPNS